MAKKTVKKAAKKTAKKVAKKLSAQKLKAKVTKKATEKAVVKKSVKKVAKSASISKVMLGQSVADFSLLNEKGSMISMASLRGKNIVLFFYPKDMTPGCTLEGRDFSRLKSEFEKSNTQVFGISRDSVKSHQKFVEKECFTIELLSDESEHACNLFGVIKEKNMYGKKVMGIERSTFLIDSNGVLQKEWRGVKVDGHAEEVLAAVRSLN